MLIDVSDKAWRARRRWRAALSAIFLASAGLTASCGSEEAPTTNQEPATPPPVVYASARTSAPASVAAGDTIVVSCTLVDAQGLVSQPPSDADLEIVFVPKDSVKTDESGKTVAVRAGRVDVRCTFPSFGVGDDVGAEIAITPGPIASVDTAVSATSVVAGGDVTATCIAHDAFGNVVPDAKPTLTSAPSDAGNVVTDLKGNFTHAGVYDLACTIPGATTHAMPIEVVAGPPASIVISPTPMKTLYSVGSVVTVETLVADQYNNPIANAPTQYDSSPNASGVLGANHFQYLANGFYTLLATVAPPTSTGQPLVAQVQIEVGGNGPTIECDRPNDGGMINANPGSVVAIGDARGNRVFGADHDALRDQLREHRRHRQERRAEHAHVLLLGLQYLGGREPTLLRYRRSEAHPARGG
jgi:hypothetical protein